MFEDLVGSSLFHRAEKADDEDMRFIRENLISIAPDFVEFVGKFGSVDIGDGHFSVYGWIQDLAEFFEQMAMGQKPNADAWLFGDNFSGEFYAIEKKTGEVVFVSAGHLDPDEIRYPSFDKFIRGIIAE